MPVTILTLDELEAHCRRQGALSPQTGLRLIAENRRLREALESLACYNDRGGNKHLAETGSYSSFDEPGSVRVAREALVEEPTP